DRIYPLHTPQHDLRTGERNLQLTGHTGFVGRHVMKHLNAGRSSSWRLIPPVPHDLLDPASLDNWLVEQCPDAVLHLAGQTFVPAAAKNPADTLQVNLLGTLNLLQALKRRGFNGTFLYVS